MRGSLFQEAVSQNNVPSTYANYREVYVNKVRQHLENGLEHSPTNKELMIQETYRKFPNESCVADKEQPGEEEFQDNNGSNGL